MYSKLHKRLLYVDKLFCLFSLLLVIIGIFTIYSAAGGAGGRGGYFASRQFIWAVISMFFFSVLLSADYRWLFEWSYRIYALSLIILLIVLFAGSVTKGSQSWLSLGPFHIQPSEFGKVAFALVLSRSLARNKPDSFINLAKILALSFPAILLVLLQPDLGSAAVYLFMLFAGILLAGGFTRYIGALFGAGLALLPLVWAMLKDYQKMRLAVFLNPSVDPLGAGYNVIQSRIAVGSGGFWGKGFLQGTQSKLHFLPEPHTDFIFSVFAEEFGFAGSILLLLIFLMFSWRLVNAALNTKDIRAKYFISMVTAWIAFQMGESIAMSVGLMPVTGLPLPFVSYGGSSLLSIFIALGIIASIQLSGVKIYK